MANFYAVLPSNSCPLTQPKNRAASYRVDQENHVQLDGKWEVALTEFSFNYCPPIFNPLVKITSQRIQRPREYLKLVLVNGVLNYGGKSGILEVIFHKDHRTMHLFCKKFPYTLKFFTKLDAAKFGSDSMIIDCNTEMYDFTKPVANESYNAEVIFEYNEDLVVTVDHEYADYPNFSEASAIVEYFKNEAYFDKIVVNGMGKITFSIDNSLSGLVFDPDVAISLGFFPTTTFSNKPKGVTFVADNPPKLVSRYNQYYIYASIIDPIIVGGNKVPLLRTLWVESKYILGDVISEVLDNPMYLNTSSNTLNNIEVEIRDDAGNYIPFPYGSKSCITLHFKKK